MNYKPIPAFSFDALTPIYDLLSNIFGFGSTQRKQIIDLLDLKNGQRLLDVGCGTGSLLVIAKKMYPMIDMIGVDIDQKILEIAKHKSRIQKLEINFVLSGSENMRFAKETFDVVVSSLVFHHLPTNIKIVTLTEIYRILKPNGKFLLVDFGNKNNLLMKIYLYIATILHIPEALTLKDNIEGKLPLFIKETGFKYKEVSQPYRGIQYLLCIKN
jgi:ubiquinone/menaquinone biosynthesis C-methylase UbiE